MHSQHDSLISKTFIFQNELTSSQQPIDILLRQDIQQINIGEIVDIFVHKNAILLPLALDIYNQQTNLFIPIDKKKAIEKFYLYSPVILIRYKILESDKGRQGEKEEIVEKKERNRERSIREVLQYVKQWREIHGKGDPGNGKVSLQDAAKIVGISKKSLDDYFCQLRLAEEYGFDFGGNMEERIGVMRAFVKKFRGKGVEGEESKAKHERLPKKLRVLEDLQGEGNFIRKNEEQNEKMDDIKLQVMEVVIPEEIELPLPTITENEYQNKFISSFNMSLDEFDDSFINFTKKESSKGGGFYMEPEEVLF